MVTACYRNNMQGLEPWIWSVKVMSRILPLRHSRRSSDSCSSPHSRTWRASFTLWYQVEILEVFMPAVDPGPAEEHVRKPPDSTRLVQVVFVFAWTCSMPGFLPTCQVRVVRFYVSCTASPSSSDLIYHLSIAVGLAGPPLPALDRSGPRRTSTTSSRSQWASPAPNC